MEGLLDRVDQVRCARIDDELIGFSRTISDGVQVALIQDLLVHPKWQRHGIGRHLLTSMMEHYSGLRQIVLLSDDIPEIVAFYESCGLHDIAREEGKAFVGYLRVPLRVMPNSRRVTASSPCDKLSPCASPASTSTASELP
ncbi:GNAT family N-acetyltransferase [Cutibacterium avidum]|uniref:GNAT family N-acetyltransferase n=1 Tax=Cutibacterium avidum TaxID=33010 RepID=UPI001F4E85AA|nr:GNAT family N-acetyltransferase [Cutibacterium avidum]MDK7698300.1 GNAT family N-acetyltransferase [Cutibacterium avidum]